MADFSILPSCDFLAVNIKILTKKASNLCAPITIIIYHFTVAYSKPKYHLPANLTSQATLRQSTSALRSRAIAVNYNDNNENKQASRGYY